MESKHNSATAHVKQKVELFLSYWKWIALSGIVAILLGYSYLRYATDEYKANATIKIKDETQSNKLPSIEEVTAQGFFSQGSDKIKDEISIMQSRTIAEKIIKTLGLNIRYFTEGKIKEKELYTNPPIKISFFKSDSVIANVDTTLYLKVKSASEFVMFKDNGKSLIERNDSDGKVYTFGEKIETNYGGYVLIPNVGSFKPRIGRNIKITITPIIKVVKEYKEAVKISTAKGTSIIQLELKQSVAQKAIDYLNQLIIEYNKDVLVDKEEIVKVTSDFINNRLQKVSQELEKVDYTSEQLEKKFNLTALSTQDNLNLQAEQNIQAQISSTSNNIELVSYLQETLNDPERTSDMLPADIGIGDSNTSQVIKNHNALVAERDRYLRNSSDKNPVVIQLNNQIESLKSNLAGSLNNIKQTSVLTLTNLNKQNSRVRGQLFSAPTKAKKFADIKRQQSIKESLYLYLLQKKEESAIRLGMYSPNAKIIDSAYSSHKPVAPNKMIVYLASIIFGLFMPIGLVYVIDLLDTKVYQKKDLVDILDIPYLGDIPKSSKKTKLIKKVDYSSKAEAFRIIRSNLDFMLKSTTAKSKKIFITSTKAQEGKSHTSTNLASSISFSEKSVLLIEMDIRAPKILDYLGIKDKPEKGLSDYIADSTIKPQDIVVKIKNNAFFDIISSGTIPPNPSELLMNERVDELFKYFENKYDYIIADTSAVGLVSDTLLISKFADIFVYVVSADNVDKRQLVHVASTLYKEKRLPNMTMLLNSVRPGQKGYGYGYGYGNNPSNKKKWYHFFKPFPLI